MAGADGLPRLPRISGAPPFTVKGPKNGKPGLDRARLDEPAFDECFGYVPLLALGGPETADHLEKVKLREHIALISQFTGLLER